MNAAEVTYCDACSHVMTYVTTDRGAKSELPAYRWLCAARKREDSINFVSRTHRLVEPYYRCSVVNLGSCRHYEPKREANHV